MAALHDALVSLAPTPWDDIASADLKSFLDSTFADAQTLVDSVPIPSTSSDTPKTGRSRANTASSFASNASEISESSARSTAPSEEIETLKAAWGKPVKVNPKENPLGINVYKMAGNDKKGAWFARRSVHEGLGFKKWKRALEAEFPETMKVQGAPGEGNIRGIGGERRVEFKDVEGLGRVEVYHLSAQFPGPTTPRDFVTLLMTSESALDEKAAGTTDGQIPRHFMIVSRPCIHPDCPEREGFIRGQYQSVEFIREIPLKSVSKSASTTDLPQPKARNRSDSSALMRDTVNRNARKAHGSQVKEDEKSTAKKASASDTDLLSKDDSSPEDDAAETNPIEWIMITRSDPGGSVPRFMIERGTPGGIIGDASKFLDWACSKGIDELARDIPPEVTSSELPQYSEEHNQNQIHDYQTNGHLAGLQTDGAGDTPRNLQTSQAPQETRPAGLYGYVTSAAGLAGATIAAYTPDAIKNRLPGHAIEEATHPDEPLSYTRRFSSSTASSDTSTDSFASAQSNGHPKLIYADNSLAHRDADVSSVGTGTSAAVRKMDSQQEKELQRLEDKKRKLDERLQRERERELSKKSEDSEREAAAIKKAEEKHRRDVEKQEEKYKREVEKLERKKEKEQRKKESRRAKESEKDERTRLARDLELSRAELDVAKKERDILRGQVGELQRENTALAARIGSGPQGRQLLDEVRKETGGGESGVLHAEQTPGGKENTAPAV